MGPGVNGGQGSASGRFWFCVNGQYEFSSVEGSWQILISLYILVFSLSPSLFLSLSLSLSPSLSKKSYLLHLLKPGVFFLLTLKYLVSKSVCFCCHLVSKILTLQLSDNTQICVVFDSPSSSMLSSPVSEAVCGALG